MQRVLIVPERGMASIEKIDIDPPREIAAEVRQPMHAEDLRAMWQEAIEDRTPGVPAGDVLNRLERKYQALADAADRSQ